jgi:sigma-B regulation protein RsbU (phosphoserine phosphatase)
LIREIPRPIYTYIIILTSRSDKSDIVSGIEAGADDFVSKPFDKDELRVRLLAGERIIKLERALKQQNDQLRNANERIHHGLLAAARVQQSMLPRKNINTPQINTAWKYVPTDELAGDAIGLHLIDDRYLIAYVLDVSGHGVPAALLSVSAMHSMEPNANNASLLRDMRRSKGCIGTVRPPAQVAADLNRRFRPGENDGRFMTLVLCVLDTQNGQLHFTCAGHPTPLVLRHGIAVEVPEAGGFPISVMDDAEYEEGRIQLQSGDRICLFSDGIVEQNHATLDDEYGTVRLMQFLNDRQALPLEQIVTELPQDLAVWAGSAGFKDDVSLVLLEWMQKAS